MPILDLFRKRPPSTSWDDSFELVNFKTLRFRTTDTYIFTCPDDIYCEFVSFTAQVIYTSGITSRSTWLDIRDGSETLFMSSVYLLAGVGTHQFHFGDHSQQSRSNAGLQRLVIPFPKPAYLLPGWRLRFLTEASLSFDEIRWTNLLVKQWYIR